MTRETVATKAARYVCEGRLVVTSVIGDEVRAICRGDGQLYHCGHEPGRGWHCDCPARGDRCAHLAALRLVTIRRAPQ